MKNKHATLIVNLGTPKEPTPREVRKYLKLFLSDRRVIRTTPWLWHHFLNPLSSQLEHLSLPNYIKIFGQILKVLRLNTTLVVKHPFCKK